MQQKKGIRIKTKQTSLVDNIVNFFKKDTPQIQLSQNQIIQQKNTNRDASPRSTTPRRKIFDKTPQKVGRIILNAQNNNNFNRTTPTKLQRNSFDNKFNQITFNEQRNQAYQPNNFSIGNHNNIINFNNNNNHNKNGTYPLQDTQFNRLIDHSTSSILQNKNNPNRYVTLQLNQQQQPIHLYPSLKGTQLQRINKMSQQIFQQKQIIDELKRQNNLLKNQNQQFFRQIQNLKKKLKQYQGKKVDNNQINSQNNYSVQIVQLDDGPKSPFQKTSQVVQYQQKSPLNHKNFATSVISIQSNNNVIPIKQSLPKMPQVSHQFDSKQTPKLDQINLRSMNMKDRSFDSLLSSEQHSFEKGNQRVNHKNQNQINQILTPSQIQKTVYDKTVKPNNSFQNQKNKRPLPIIKQSNNQNLSKSPRKQQQKDNSVFYHSQTVGYLKGVQFPKSNNNNTNKNNLSFDSSSSLQSHQQKIKIKNNQFHEIASQSNKFYFKQQHQQSIINDNNKSNNFKTKQWMKFEDEPGSLNYSTSSNNMFKKSKLSENNLIDQSKSINKSNTIINKSKTNNQQDKSYKFVDFQVNDDQSALDFF